MNRSDSFQICRTRQQKFKGKVILLFILPVETLIYVCACRSKDTKTVTITLAPRWESQ